MKTTPHREKDGGPIINWAADVLNHFACWLISKTSSYALMYVVEFDDDIEELLKPLDNSENWPDWVFEKPTEDEEPKKPLTREEQWEALATDPNPNLPAWIYDDYAFDEGY